MQDETLDIIDVMEETVGVISKRFGELALLALVFVGLPGLIVSFLSSQMFAAAMASPSMTPQFSLSYWLISILIGLLPLMLQASVIFTTVETLTSRPSGFATSVAVALSVFFPLVLLTFLMSIGLAIGFMLFVVPGLVLMVFWIVVVPVFVVERSGIFGAFERSAELTKGNRWRIFGLVVLVAVIYFIVTWTIGGMFIALMGGLTNLESLGEFSLVWALINALLSMITSVISAVGVSVLYVHLRDLTEGTSAETIGNTFG